MPMDLTGDSEIVNHKLNVTRPNSLPFALSDVSLVHLFFFGMFTGDVIHTHLSHIL